MEILEVLKESRKAMDDISVDYYVKENDDGILCWYHRDTDIYHAIVIWREIIKNTWQPYHKVEEIRPENAGELWTFKGGESYAHTFGICGDVYLLSDGCKARKLSEVKDIMPHGKYWTRLYPPVEDDSVVIVEFEIPKEG
jgi:hypothetical protein